MNQEMTTEHATFEVSGMSCRSCQARIEAALHDMEGVLDERLEFERKRLFVAYDPDLASEALINEVLADLGYQARVIS